MCGGLAYYRVAEQVCKGYPAAMVGQPGHGANIEYELLPSGKWNHKIFASVWVNDKYVTYVQSGNEMMTDDVPGIQKTREETVATTLCTRRMSSSCCRSSIASHL